MGQIFAGTCEIMDQSSREKLAELYRLLGVQSGLHQQDVLLSLEGFAKQLFTRCPADYAAYTSVETMLEIARDSFAFFCNFLQSNSPHGVQVKNSIKPNSDEAVTIIRTAIGDRPFIIDTITEILSHNKLDYNVLLHPIIETEPGNLVSTTYIELPIIEDDNLIRHLETEISTRFKHLLCVTDDFAKIVDNVTLLTRHVRAQIRHDHSSLSDKGLSDKGLSDEGEMWEIADFLDWLNDGGFVFLGYREWPTDDETTKQTLASIDTLGLFRAKDDKLQTELSDIRRDVDFLRQNKANLICSKILTKSTVHRSAPMDLICLKVMSAEDSTTSTKIVSILGLLTSKALAQESSSVPIIRRKLAHILQAEHLAPNTHDYKEIISIFNTMPKDDLLRYPIEALTQAIISIFSLQRRSEVRLSYYISPMGRFLNVYVVVPRARFSTPVREKIQHYFEKLAGAEIGRAQANVTFTDYPLVVIRLLIPLVVKPQTPLNIATLEEDVTKLTLTWSDELFSLFSELEERTARRLTKTFSHAFPEEYQAVTDPRDALVDLLVLQELNPNNSLELRLFPLDELGKYCLKLYRLEGDFTLSGIIPFLENVGLEAESEQVSRLASTDGKKYSIRAIFVKPRTAPAISEILAKEVILPGLSKILQGEVENDPLNSLLLNPVLDVRRISLLRSFVNYLWQIRAVPSRGIAMEALTDNPEIARILAQYFEGKFSPALGAIDSSERQSKMAALQQEFQTAVKSVDRLIHDRTLRAMLALIEAMVRTNYFCREAGYRLAFKIDSAKIPQMPKPRPLCEIFVDAPTFEGIHLRGGLVARGGIRWSERKEDYRTEVLGLMKTQMVKNAIIVPVGAKGGFLVRHPSSDRAQLAEQVATCYRSFVYSLLELTDNRREGQLIPPPHCVVYDQADPYLVVAADRGTATFSDLANGIAQQDFSFWLDDAFASGGSNGYDHKKYGITARGAWQSVLRHFNEIGLDIESTPFTAVGIGDMSGDVFGNGLLLSNNVKLLAAFNHRHIFIDPNPDPLLSFEERQRLFALPGSQWSDYSTSAISSGGGVYERSAKEIRLSPEAVTALGLSDNLLTGDEVVRAILGAPVDLLWNGGIGTYVKAFAEDNMQVGDRTNDEVRINARDLRAKVVAEGGNLGFTQLARIEYSKIGGKINTDAIDNSGGVNMSDIEVNLKILFAEPMRRGELTREARNKVLASCAEEACEKVITRNRLQTRAISLAVKDSREHLSYYRGFIEALEQNANLDRSGECLPDEETFEKRASLKAGLTRPELAILLAYAKMSIFKAVLDSALPEEKFLEQILALYFPRSIREQFSSYLTIHPLRREIIATQVANVVVEQMGPTFVYKLCEETSVRAIEVVRAFLIASALWDGDSIFKELEKLDTAQNNREFYALHNNISVALTQMTRWLLVNCKSTVEMNEQVSLLREPFSQLIHSTSALRSENEQTRHQSVVEQLMSQGLSKVVSEKLASSSNCSTYLDIVQIAQTSRRDVISVAVLYMELAYALQLPQVTERLANLVATNRWEGVALRSLESDIHSALGRIAQRIMEISDKNISSDKTISAVGQFLETHSSAYRRYLTALQETQSEPGVATLIVLAKLLASLGARSN